MKRIGKLVALAVLAVAAWLLFAPTDVQPVAWAPAKAPAEEGFYAVNRKLAAVERLGKAGGLNGPDSLVLDAEGRVLTGLADGRVARMSADGKTVETLVNTGGRPLGLAFAPDGKLVVADGLKGLVSFDLASKKLDVLTTTAAGAKIGFADDVKVAADGRVYFSDASRRWGLGQDGEAIMEHGGDGRLLRYDPASRATEVLLDGLQFATGVALGPDDSYVLVVETGAYRIVRLWLKGEKAGKTEIFADNLPGFPDNMTFNGRDRFWVAVYAPRNPMIDAVAGHPFVRKMIVRAMQVLPKPVEHRAMVLGLDLAGKPVVNLQDDGAGNYSPVTHVAEGRDGLWLGSLFGDSVARLPLAALKP